MKINNNIQQLKQCSFGSLSNLSSRAAKYIQDVDKVNSVGQRAILGVTAMFLQPMIDMSNKDVDQKTRESSAIRSIARNGIGMLTGVTVRAATIKFAEKFTGEGKFLDFKASEKSMEAMTKQGKKIVKSLADASEKQIKNYSATMGTLLGLCVMLFTNFLVDIPLINASQNKIDNLYQKHHMKKEAKKNEEAVSGSSN